MDWMGCQKQEMTYVDIKCVCVCVLLTHLRLCCEISSDKVRGEQPHSLVRFPFPPVGVTETKKKATQIWTEIEVFLYKLNLNVIL